MNITKTENLLLKQFELQPAGAEDKPRLSKVAGPR